MPRSNRPRNRRPGDSGSEADLSPLLVGWRRTETRRGVNWVVQPVTAESAVKAYLCPGCRLQIAPRTAHLVAWRADGVLGDEADLAARRHWHLHCWRVS